MRERFPRCAVILFSNGRQDISASGRAGKPGLRSRALRQYHLIVMVLCNGQQPTPVIVVASGRASNRSRVRLGAQGGHLSIMLFFNGKKMALVIDGSTRTWLRLRLRALRGVEFLGESQGVFLPIWKMVFGLVLDLDPSVLQVHMTFDRCWCIADTSCHS